MTFARAMRYGGRGVIVAGVVILLFVIYQLWGTSLQYARAQSGLRGDFESLLSQAQELDSPQLTQSQLPQGEENQNEEKQGEGNSNGEEIGSEDTSAEKSTVGDPTETTAQAEPTTTIQPADQTSPTEPPTPPIPQPVSSPLSTQTTTPTQPNTVTATTRLPTEVLQNSEIVLADGVEEILPLLYTEQGEAVARIRIPRIGLDEIVVEGTSVDDLRKGPGHYAWTPMPGQPGNVSIAGHRTTYGAPFGDIGNLRPGDKIFVQTVQGEFEYEVLAQSDPNRGTIIVTPDRVDLLRDLGDNRLTLTSCHPKFSSRQRIVVQAKLIGDPVVPIRDLLNQSPAESSPVPVVFATEEFPDEDSETESAAAPGESAAQDLAANGAAAPATSPTETTQPTTQEAPAQAVAVPPTTQTANPPAAPNQSEAATARTQAAQPENSPPAQPPQNSPPAQPQNPPAASTQDSSATQLTSSDDGFGTGLNGDRSAIPSAVLWGMATLLVWAAVWLVGSRWRMWPSVAVGLIPLMFCLFVAFNYVDRAIPSY